MKTDLSVLYTLSIGATPLLVFKARNFSEARELASEAWLIGEIQNLRISGQPLASEGKLWVARASDAEQRAYTLAMAGKEASHDELELVYLIKVDDNRRAARTG